MNLPTQRKVDIWMPLSIGDYLADTSHLSTVEHGAYLLLLMHYWRKGPLPNDIAKVATICKLDRDAWSIAQALLTEFFILQDDGLYHQARSDREISKWQGKKQKAKKKASEAANKRWHKDAPGIPPSTAQSNAQAMLGTCPLPSPLPKEQISEAKASSPRRDADGEPRPEPEELIYAEYPRKEGHRAAIKAIGKAVERIRKGEGVIPPMEPREARIYLYRRVQTYARAPAGARADRTLVPHPATWFNESRYLDDESNWQLTGGQSNGGTGTHQANGRSPAKERIDGTRRKLAEALERRGIPGPWDGDGSAGTPLPEPGHGGIDRGVHGGFRTVGAAVLDGKGTTRSC